MFRDADDAWECLGGLFEVLSRDAEVGPKLRDEGFVLRFNDAEPALSITVGRDGGFARRGARGGPARGRGRVPQVELDMSADVAHRVWLGGVNPMMAMMKRALVAREPIALVMKLLPLVRPAYEIVPKLLAEERGHGALVEVEKEIRPSSGIPLDAHDAARYLLPVMTRCGMPHGGAAAAECQKEDERCRARMVREPGARSSAA